MRTTLRDLLTLASGAAAAAVLLAAGLATAPDAAAVLHGSVSSLQGLAGFAAAAAGLALALWWSLGLLLAVLAAGLAKAGHAAAAAAAGALAPAFMKRLAAAALGLNLVSGLAAPAQASAPVGEGVGQVIALVQPAPGAGADLPQLPGSSLTADDSVSDTVGTGASPHWKPRIPPPGENLLIRPGRMDTAPAAVRATVRSGDSLWSLAAQQLGPLATDAEIAAQWPRWYERNRAVIGDRPELILPGQILEVPEIPGM